ncbi:Fanconi-associated nuclease [Quillaja saponaria]|uniref:Fanconi-associated nuclease n=1 Tax=Quillaja saponaria TaxID=32244 RepID=A0AAD7QCZ8_QUISA|nr:Fanconi-associated nuclease [Quillaja saponaria]
MDMCWFKNGTAKAGSPSRKTTDCLCLMFQRFYGSGFRFDLPDRYSSAKSRSYNEGGEQCGVEQLALQFYAGEGGGCQGVHMESGIWLTIFGLLIWDVIFADVLNVFCTRFQNAPLDLDTDSFYSVRKNSIESHLQKIHDGMAEEILLKSWGTQIGILLKTIEAGPVQWQICFHGAYSGEAMLAEVKGTRDRLSEQQ